MKNNQVSNPKNQTQQVENGETQPEPFHEDADLALTDKKGYIISKRKKELHR